MLLNDLSTNPQVSPISRTLGISQGRLHITPNDPTRAFARRYSTTLTIIVGYCIMKLTLSLLDTFELQAKRTADGTFQSQREELEFDGLAEEDGDIYDEENDDDDDGDALSSSPSIPDEVGLHIFLFGNLTDLCACIGYRLRFHVRFTFFRGHGGGAGKCHQRRYAGSSR